MTSQRLQPGRVKFVFDEFRVGSDLVEIGWMAIDGMRETIAGSNDKT